MDDKRKPYIEWRDGKWYSVQELESPPLEHCPFCGNITTLELQESTRVPNLNQWVVFCNAADGGCGASCGYGDPADTLEQGQRNAINKWNRRSWCVPIRDN